MTCNVPSEDQSDNKNQSETILRYLPIRVRAAILLAVQPTLISFPLLDMLLPLMVE